MGSPGALLREWRVREGWTQAEVAAAVRVTPRAVSNWEVGVARPPLHALAALDEAFAAGGALVDLMRAINMPRVIGPQDVWLSGRVRRQRV